MSRCPESVSRKRFYDLCGYDAKYLMHTIRILRCGYKYLNTGIFDPVVPEIDREFYMNIRRGQISRNNGLSMVDDLQLNIDYKVAISPFAKTTDAYDLANHLSCDISWTLLTRIIQPCTSDPKLVAINMTESASCRE